MALLLCVVTYAALTARGDTPATSPTAPESASQADPAARPLLRRSAERADASARPAAGGSSAWVRTTAALAGVVGLIVLLTWGYRTVMGASPAWRTRPRHPGLIEVLCRTPLSPRQSLCLVRVGPQLVLLGVTPERVQTLHVISDANVAAGLLGEATRARSDSNSAAFSQTLDREARAYAEPSPESADPAADLKAAHDRVLSALARLRTKEAGA
jgi:flagellar protein FliO/FliZ